MTAAASHHHSLVFGSASAPITHSAVDGMTQISMLTACRAHQRRRAEEIEEDDADVAGQERDREQQGASSKPREMPALKNSPLLHGWCPFSPQCGCGVLWFVGPLQLVVVIG